MFKLIIKNFRLHNFLPFQGRPPFLLPCLLSSLRQCPSSMAVSAVPPQRQNDPQAVNLNEAESCAGLGCTRPYGYVSDRGMRGIGRRGKRKGSKDEGVGHSMGEVEESLLGRMEKYGGWGRWVTTENTATQVAGEKNESKHGSQLEERGGGTQRCTARSKLPGINLEVAGRRMQGGGREGRVVAGVDMAFGHLAEKLDSKKNK